MSIITDMATVLARLIKSDLKLESVKRESFYEFLDLLKSENQVLQASINGWNAKERAVLTKRIEVLMTNKANKSAAIYKQFRGKLVKKASALETKEAFGAILNVSSKFDTILADIEDGVEKLFVDKNLTIGNTRVSHLIVFGVIKDCHEFIKFSRAIFGTLTTELSGELGATAGFRMNTIIDHQGVVNTINRVCKEEGAYSFLHAIDKLNQNGSNLLLYSGNKLSFTDFLIPKAFTKTAANLTLSGLIGINIFRFLGEGWNTYQAKRQKLKELDKDWMESRVALLKLDLVGVDHNDPRYLELIKIIDNYEGMINKLNQDIAKLENR